MKTLQFPKMTLYLFPAALLFFSCSPDATVTPYPQDDATNNGLVSRTQNNILPFNEENTFDEAGAVHTELISEYYAHEALPNSIDAIAALVNSTVRNNTAFQNLGPYSTPIPDAAQVHHLLKQKQEGGLDALIACTALTTTAKASFKEFLNIVQYKVSQNIESEILCNFIIDYEIAVIHSKSLSASDKEILLITCSITRHSVHFRKKRPKKNTDPDWDWLTLHIAGAATGASESAAEAVALSLACGIVENR